MNDLEQRIKVLEDTVARLAQAREPVQQFQATYVPAYSTLRIPANQQILSYGVFTVGNKATVQIEGDLVIL